MVQHPMTSTKYSNETLVSFDLMLHLSIVFSNFTCIHLFGFFVCCLLFVLADALGLNNSITSSEDGIEIEIDTRLPSQSWFSFRLLDKQLMKEILIKSRK